MIRLHACQMAWEQSEWGHHHRVFLIRHYQVASADRAGDGCITSRLCKIGLPTGTWGEPSDLITMVTSVLLIRCLGCVYRYTWMSCSDCGVVILIRMGVDVLDNNYKCWWAQICIGACRGIVLYKSILKARNQVCYDSERDCSCIQSFKKQMSLNIELWSRLIWATSSVVSRNKCCGLLSQWDKTTS